jgi:hypothetical protein
MAGWCSLIQTNLIPLNLKIAVILYHIIVSILLPHPTGWTIGVPGFDSRRGLGIFLFITASRTALGLTQPPIQWVPGALSLGVRRPGHEANHSPPSSAEVKEWVELYLHYPNTPSWRCAQLRKSTGTTLPLPSRKCTGQTNTGPRARVHLLGRILLYIQ